MKTFEEIAIIIENMDYDTYNNLVIYRNDADFEKIGLTKEEFFDALGMDVEIEPIDFSDPDYDE